MFDTDRVSHTFTYLNGFSIELFILFSEYATRVAYSHPQHLLYFISPPRGFSLSPRPPPPL